MLGKFSLERLAPVHTHARKPQGSHISVLVTAQTSARVRASKRLSETEQLRNPNTAFTTKKWKQR